MNAQNRNTAKTVTEIVREQVLKEWVVEHGHGPDPHAPGDEEIFEGYVIQRMKELGQSDLYEMPDDLPDSLPD